jgi:YidC/Oxa1 family membrane protein insertase
MKERNTIVALVLMGLILLLTPTYMRLISGPGAPPAGTFPAPVDTLAAPADSLVAMPADTGRAPEILSESEQSAAPAVSEPVGSAGTHLVETPRYRGLVSERGAAIVGWRLRGFTVDGGVPVQMIPAQASGPVAELPFGDLRIDTGALTFQSDMPDTVRLAPGESRTFTFQAGSAEGWSLQRRMTFSGDSWDVRVEDRVAGLQVSPVNDRYRLWWRGGLSFTEPDRREDLGYSGFYALQGGDVHSTKLKATEVESQLTGRVDWAALRTKYFAAILIPEESGGAFEGARMTGAAGDTGPARMTLGVDRELRSGEGTNATRVYLGPMDYHTLLAYERDLQKMMDFGPGFIRPIGKLILNLFTWMHGFLPNYGLVIIIFSILVKLAVFPLTRKSYESMHAMQELAPKMTEIRAKYKDDAEKMNRKMMNLYKEHKVNPLGGCFPLLLQMPIFWALFVVFRSTIELRGAPFVLWITDLSLADPYLVLPGIMAVSQFIQSRAQMKDPRQRTMAYILPVVMFFIFKGFAAGLVLYWTMFNILSVVQTEIIHPRKSAAAPS